LKKYLNWKTVFVLMLVMLFAAACTASSDAGNTADGAESTVEDMEHEDVEHDDDHEHEEGEDHEHEKVPNNGAAVHIVAPADGATFAVGDEVIVEVEVENFTLGDGNHWHIYVDGSSWGMVMGENTDDTLRGLEAGEHEISVSLSIDTHEEMEDGDTIMIMVEE
jgi:hypothetical protein